MSLVGFKAQNHPQQTFYLGPVPHVDDRALPPEDFAKLNERFKFTLDAAAAPHNAKLPNYYSEQNCGLSNSWRGERVYCNPPFSDIRPWIEKAWSESDHCPVIVMLLPANRTEQTWWQEGVEPYRDRHSILRVEFLPGRLRFLSPGESTVKPNSRPPFGCCLLIWQREVAS